MDIYLSKASPTGLASGDGLALSTLKLINALDGPCQAIFLNFLMIPCKALINKQIVITLVTSFEVSESQSKVNKCAKNCMGMESIYPLVVVARLQHALWL
jgi:hypothetical protein